MHSDDAATAAALDGAVTLGHWGLMRAQGPDAATFLHAQLTNAFTGFGEHDLRLAGLCSAKGRLQASFLAWRSGPDEFLLACHASLLAPTVKRLRMFVLRAKCSLGEVDDRVCTGLVGPAAARSLEAAGSMPRPGWQRVGHADGDLLRLPPVDGVERAVWVAAPGVPPPGPADATPSLPLDAWRWLEVRSGVPVVQAATVDQFVPQMLNYELVGGVDFRKGCYPGQEVVARSQYRGTVKRRMLAFHSPVACAAGQEVVHDADPGQPAGMVVDAAPRPGGAGHDALVEVKLAAASGGALHLGQADGPPLQPLALPYPLPTPGPGDDA
jgi:folate-binding protein YgfZ